MTDRQVARIVACELQFDISNEDVALLDRVLALEELIDAEHTGRSLEDRICTIENAVGLAEERERAEAEETAKRQSALATHKSARAQELAALRSQHAKHLAECEPAAVTQQNFSCSNVWLRMLERINTAFVRALVDSQPHVCRKEVLFRDFDRTAPPAGAGAPAPP